MASVQRGGSPGLLDLLPEDVLARIADKCRTRDRQAAWVSLWHAAVTRRPQQNSPPLCVASAKCCRIRLAATCSALRTASVRWFRNDDFFLSTDEPPTDQHLAWLCRVQGELSLMPVSPLRHAVPIADSFSFCLHCTWHAVPVEVELGHNVHMLGTFSTAGARIVKATMVVPGSMEHVPAELAGLTQLTQLVLAENNIKNGWQHLPQHLQELHLYSCGLHHVPAQLRALCDSHSRSFF